MLNYNLFKTYLKSVPKSLAKCVLTKKYDPNIYLFERAAKDHGRTQYLPEIADQFGPRGGKGG